MANVGGPCLPYEMFYESTVKKLITDLHFCLAIDMFLVIGINNCLVFPSSHSIHKTKYFRSMISARCKRVNIYISYYR